MANGLPKLVSDALPSALLDMDLTIGAGALPSGWAVLGSGSSYSTEDGLYLANTAYIRTDNFASRQTLLDANQGYILMQIERQALSVDKSYNSATTFYDSDGYTDTSTEKSLLWTDDGVGGWQFRIYRKATDYTLNCEENFSSKYSSRNVSRRSPFFNDRFANVILTWSGTSASLIIDGTVVKQMTLSNANTGMKRIYIGAYGGAKFIGPYYLRRIIIGAQYLHPNDSGFKCAFLGDSFVVAASDRGEPADTDNTSVSELDGLQSATSINALNALKLGNYRGAAPAIFQMQAMFNFENGTFLPCYNSGSSGNGWRTTSRASNLQIAAPHIDAVVAYQPKVVFLIGSVNDLSTTAESFTVGTDIIPRLDSLIDGIAGLRKIYVVQTFGWYHSTNSLANTAGWKTNYKLYQNQLRKLHDYRGKVEFVGHNWGDEPPIKNLLGSNTDNVSTSFGSDFHPSPTGQSQIAQVLYPLLKKEYEKAKRSNLIPTLIGSIVS